MFVPIAVLVKAPLTAPVVVGVLAALAESVFDLVVAACDFFRCAAGLER